MASDKIDKIEPFGFQTEVIDRIIGRFSVGDGCLLALDTGLGKTAVSVWAMQAAGADRGKGVIIFCPASVKGQWRHELVTKMGVDPTDVYVWGFPKKWNPSTFARAKWVIVNYQAVVKLPDRLFDGLIVDECQHIKNFKHGERYVQRTLNLLKRFVPKDRRPPFRLLVSATPTTGKVTGSWVFAHIMSGGKVGTYERYLSKPRPDFGNQPLARRQKLKAKKWEGYKWVPTSGAEAYVGEKVLGPYTIFKRKQDVDIDIPQPMVMEIPVDLEEYELSAYQSIAKHLPDFDPDNPRQVESWPVLTKIRVFLSRVKAPVSGRMAANQALRGLPVLVFSEFIGSQQIVMNVLAEKNVEVSLINGDTPINKRQAVIGQFRHRIEKGLPAVLVLALKACGAALDLSFARCVIMNDLPWRYASFKQAMDRVNRIGQLFPPLVYNLIVRDTFDNVIYGAMLKSKRKEAETLVDGA